MRRLAVVFGFALVALATDAQAQPYPIKPVKVVHGFGAGGPPDTVLRQIATRLEPRLGQPVVIENRPGASGTIAATAVARAETDGHVLLFGVAANLAVAPAIMTPPPYDPVTAFAPIVEVARGPYLWLVRADAPANNLREFIAWSRRQPGKLNYASPGNGSVHHLATEMLKQTARIDLTHVPYKGGLYTALLAGEVDAMFESMPGPLPHLASGKLRALAVSGEKRLPTLPDVPTLAEQGVRGIDVNSWWGFVGPAGMSRSVVARLNTEIARVLEEPELRSMLEKWSIEPTPATPEAFGAYIKAQSAQWRATAEKIGARAQ